MERADDPAVREHRGRLLRGAALGDGSGYAPRLSKPSGFTQSITIFPASGPARETSRSRWPLPGHGHDHHVRLAAASALPPDAAAAPLAGRGGLRARSALREPMSTGWPPAQPVGQPPALVTGATQHPDDQAVEVGSGRGLRR